MEQSFPRIISSQSIERVNLKHASLSPAAQGDEELS